MAGCGCHNNPFNTVQAVQAVQAVQKVKRKSRRSRRRQNGGFYPSVYGGVAGATMLAPLVARQAMRLYNRPTPRKSRKSNKSKKSRKTRKSKNKLRFKRG